MNTARIRLEPYIQNFDELNQVLEILFFFTDIDILPGMDLFELSPHLLQMHQHLWLSALQMALKLEIAAGSFTDAANTTIYLNQKYLLDYIIPTGMCPNHQTVLASVVDVDSLLNNINNMFLYHSISAVYRAQSQTFDTVPLTHIKVQGVGINPFVANGGWFVPNIPLDDFPDGEMVLGLEDFTPSKNLFSEAWYNAGGAMYLIIHPCLLNAVLRSNMPEIAFGIAEEDVWTWKLLSTNDPYPACVPENDIYSSDMNEHFRRWYWKKTGILLDSLQSNHIRGLWAEYDWTSTINPYLWSHSTHAFGCPLACELCYREVTGFGDDADSIGRGWALMNYGRAGTATRDLYGFLSLVPADYFPDYEEGYMFVDGRTIDPETEATVQAEWDATGSNYIPYSHYGGLAVIRWYDMIMLDRATFLMASAAHDGAFSASPYGYLRYYRHEGDRRTGILSISGKEFPEDYKIYPRGIGLPGGNISPFLPATILNNAGLEKMGIDLKLQKTASQFGKHTMTWNNEAIVWGQESIIWD
jgi:hypothetical protein